MADISDVENALAALATAALYPLGTGNGSITGQTYRIYRGYPADCALETDLASGVSHVSVLASSGTVSNLPQLPANWLTPVSQTALLICVTTGSTITFSGEATTGQLAGILVDNTAFAYRTQAGDTPASVATALAMLVNEVFFATVNGSTLTILGTSRLIARVEADQTAVLPTRRQSQEFRLSNWAPTATARDACSGAIDLSFAMQTFITLADGTAARLRYSKSETIDSESNVSIYRRDLFYMIEYNTTLVQLQPSMMFGITEIDSTGSVNLS